MASSVTMAASAMPSQLGLVAIDLPPEHAAFVDDGRLDLVAYLHYLHRHVAWLHARLAALEP